MNAILREARDFTDQYDRLVGNVHRAVDTLYAASEYSAKTFANTAKPDEIPLTRDGDDYIAWRVVFANNALMGASKRLIEAATALENWESAQ